MISRASYIIFRILYGDTDFLYIYFYFSYIISRYYYIDERYSPPHDFGFSPLTLKPGHKLLTGTSFLFFRYAFHAPLSVYDILFSLFSIAFPFQIASHHFSFWPPRLTYAPTFMLLSLFSQYRHIIRLLLRILFFISLLVPSFDI